MSNYKHFNTDISGKTLIDTLFFGYDSSNPGNFIDKGDPGYDEETVLQTATGILDIQGTAGDTRAQAQKKLDDLPKGASIKDLLQDLAGTSAAEIQEGTYQDKNYGHTYLMAVADPKYAAEHNIDVSGATVSDLYAKGLMRSGDDVVQDDIDYWEGDKQGSIADVAANFLKTSESQTHQAFDKYFGRMAGSEGLDYFAGVTGSADITTPEEEKASDRGQTLSEYIGSIIGYRGTDNKMSAETIARDTSYELAGEASTTDQRHDSYYTAPKEVDIARYRDSIRDARKLDEGTNANIHGAAAETAVKDEIFSKANQLLGANLGDYDDLGGITAGNATGMGRFLSDAEQQTGFEKGKTGQDWYDETKDTVWGALKGEVDKTTIDPRDIIVTGGGKIDTEAWLKQRAKDQGDTDFDINDYRMWNQRYLDEGGEKKIVDPEEWTLDPKKPDLPTDITINKEKVDYMPGFTSDVQLPSDVKYADRAKEFDTEYKSVPGTAKTAQGTAGQRFTGTSAKGVRMKRSKASRMGTIRGTKQLGREQQLKSLNI